jgi:hypothetical protein
MAARFLYLYLPLSLAALLGLAGSAPLVQPSAKPGSASAVWASATSRWRIVQTFRLAGGSSSVTSVAATSTRNAWATALVCGPQSCGPASTSPIPILGALVHVLAGSGKLLSEGTSAWLKWLIMLA